MLEKSITEAKAKLPELINLVHVKSEQVVIRKHNVPVAVIIPFSQMPQKKKAKKLNITLAQLEKIHSVFDKYAQGEPFDVSDEAVRKMRDNYLVKKYLKWSYL